MPYNSQRAQNEEEKPKDGLPKPSYRQWAKWAGYDCGE